ncbi:hypothetical protein IMG5_137970 [Ichthyophthirius multifiliis]|uniref:Transmembrane protein n=1 Tax=Ichthyophthirius multifiliis TaxID=5932 RepID=G0QX51_ICHMU|nr:hypothetical protein IMG5_137970 [Ichthyophthirius multifiliis]EGR30208.1 hypothetical protein IMG5_137970 [Ichthyophthirius multifiliis]|eukprot:XP_004031804.1 hypothetical protein IMG5_137970 [Ichthyophthirius multifiliis]
MNNPNRQQQFRYKFQFLLQSILQSIQDFIKHPQQINKHAQIFLQFQLCMKQYQLSINFFFEEDISYFQRKFQYFLKAKKEKNVPFFLFFIIFFKLLLNHIHIQLFKFFNIIRLKILFFRKFSLNHHLLSISKFIQIHRIFNQDLLYILDVYSVLFALLCQNQSYLLILMCFSQFQIL